MTYIPNAADAFAVYIIAITYVDDIPSHAFAPHTHMNVKQLIVKDEFYIWESEERDSQGQYHAPLAACTYDEGSATWKVQLSNGQSIVLRDAGDVWEVVQVVKKPTRVRRRKKLRSARS